MLQQMFEDLRTGTVRGMMVVAMRLVRRMIFWLIIGGVTILVLMPLLLRSLVLAQYGPRMFDHPAQLSGYRTAVVFGAAVRYGQPTTVLRDRLDTAIRLYQSGIVDRLVMSGDGRSANYNEPAVMARYATEQGVPPAAIILDPAGLRTYDTCLRVKSVFGLDQVVLVTQSFHLPRALFTCALLGIDAVGVSADQRVYQNAHWYSFRELLALPVAAFDGLVRPWLAAISGEASNS